MDQQLGGAAARREPIFNVPMAVVATLAVLVLVHLVREWVLTPPQDAQLLLWLSFIPARYDAAVAADAGSVAGLGPRIWTFVTYSIIHGNWMHLGLNGIWLLAFGTPIARRFGTVRVTSSVSGLLLIRLFKQPNSILGLVRASTATACGNLKQADKQKPTTRPSDRQRSISSRSSLGLSPRLELFDSWQPI